MGSMGDVVMDLSTDCCSSTCCCGGMGCCRQNLTGDGVAFIQAGGTIMEKDLGNNEKIRIDNTSIVGYSNSMHLGIEFAGCCGCCCGGEAFFLTLEGPGKVFMQSMNFQKYRAAVQPPVEQAGE